MTVPQRHRPRRACAARAKTARETRLPARGCWLGTRVPRLRRVQPCPSQAARLRTAQPWHPSVEGRESARPPRQRGSQKRTAGGQSTAAHALLRRHAGPRPERGPRGPPSGTENPSQPRHPSPTHVLAARCGTRTQAPDGAVRVPPVSNPDHAGTVGGSPRVARCAPRPSPTIGEGPLPPTPPRLEACAPREDPRRTLRPRGRRAAQGRAHGPP